MVKESPTLSRIPARHKRRQCPVRRSVLKTNSKKEIKVISEKGEISVRSIHLK